LNPCIDYKRDAGNALWTGQRVCV